MAGNDDNKPLVSIGMPFYNPGPYFVDAVKSVFSQTYRNWELILVDDGSRDGSLELAFQIQDTRVHVINDGRNLGRPHRRNQIIEIASGTYLAWLDADDLMHPERIARQVDFLRSNPLVDVVDTGMVVLNRDGKPKGVRGLNSNLPGPFEVLLRGGFSHPSVMARREWFLNHPYDPAYLRAEDRELFARTYLSTKFGRLAEPLYYYRFVDNLPLEGYLQSYRFERKVILKYGLKLVGVAGAAGLYVRSLVKSAVLLGFTAIGAGQLPQHRTYEQIAEDLRGEVDRLIEGIRLQKVPGW